MSDLLLGATEKVFVPDLFVLRKRSIFSFLKEGRRPFVGKFLLQTVTKFMNRAWPGIGEEALKGSIENKIHGQDGDGTKIVDGKLYPENMVITSKFSLYFRDNVGIFDVADEKVRKLETKYKEVGFCSCLHSRIWALGRTHIECLGDYKGDPLLAMIASAFEGSVFTHLDAKPGMVVKGKVTSVGDFGADVQLSTGVKEFCPLTHMSEPEVPKPGKKFKVKPQLSILSSFDYATDGLITHGWIRKVETHGSEVGLDPGCEASSIYHAGQVVKCRVMSAVLASRRINICFLMSPTRSSARETIARAAARSLAKKILKLYCGTE
ncbi:hypothetical protein C5167_012990, partial [Papaver somniferum]